MFPMPTSTDSAGVYRFDSIPFGVHGISVEAKGYIDDTRKVETIPSSPDTTLNFALKRGLTVRGYVYDRETGQPVQGATVYTRNVSVKTQADGQFELSGIPPPWDASRLLDLGVMASGYLDESFMDIDPSVRQMIYLGRPVLVRVEYRNLDRYLKNGVSVSFMMTQSFRNPPPTIKGFSIQSESNTEIELPPGLYEVTASVGGIQIYKRSAVSISDSSERLITVDFEGIDLDLLTKAEILQSEISKVNRKYLLLQMKLKGAEKQAIWEEYQAKLATLAEQHRLIRDKIPQK